MKTLLSYFSVLLLFSSACGDDGGSSGLPDGDALVVAVGSDFQGSSVLSEVVLPQVDVDVAAIDGVASLDPVIRLRGGYVIVVNRYGFDNVTVLDASELSLVAQVSTGAGTNPQDVALSGSRLYVADQAGTGLSVIDLDNPDAGATAIDLSSLDPDDGVPNCHAVEVSGSNLLVSCGVLDDGDDFLTPRGNGVIAVVDLGSEALVDSFQLEHPAPFGIFAVDPAAGDLYLATVPDFSNPTSNGCIETIRGGASPESDGCLIENQVLGGYAADISWSGDGLFVASVSGFDPDDFKAIGTAVDVAVPGAAITPFTEDAAIRAFDVAVCPGGQRVVSDAAGGLRLYDTDGSELSQGVVDIGAPVVRDGTICIGLGATTRL